MASKLHMFAFENKTDKEQSIVFLAKGTQEYDTLVFSSAYGT